MLDFDTFLIWNYFDDEEEFYNHNFNIDWRAHPAPGSQLICDMKLYD